MQQQNRISYISLFTAAAISIFVVESFIPGPIYGIRLGLANIFILMAMLFFGFREAFLIGILKSIIGSLVLARLFTPSFIFSISGTIMSITFMYLSIKYIRQLSLVGISIIGAEIHVLTQITIAVFLFFPQASIAYLLPPFMLLSLFNGAFVGLITFWLYSRGEGKIEVA